MAEPRVMLLVPTLQPRDAVGNDVMGMKGCLERAGYPVTVGAQYVHADYRKSTLKVTSETSIDAGSPDDVLIYHHAIDWELGEKILARNRRRVVMKYHNLTPAHFYAGYSESYRIACERGRAASGRLAALPGAWLWGDSLYNVGEFLALGTAPGRTRVLPPFHHIEDLVSSPLDAVVTGAFRSAGTNILFVGAFRPNKGHAKALEVFAALLQKTGRPGYLLLVGSLDPALSQYVEDILDYSRRLGVDQFVHLATSVTSMQLRAFYHVADVFLCVSEHEGFCVPLAEAMALRVPIVAWRQAAVGETLGEAGIGFDGFDPGLIAEAVESLTVSPLTATEWTDRGRLRYEREFAPARIEETFFDCFRQVVAPVKRVALVIHRYGSDVSGGAEFHCRAVAEALQGRFEVTVLTSCATDHLSWKNVLDPGQSFVRGVRVLRFRSVQVRELEEFHEIYDQIFQTQLSEEREYELLRRQGPYCPDLIDYLRTRAAEYDAFVIFTCIYYPAIQAIPLVADRAILVPLAHDEPSLYLHILDDLIPSVRTIFFNSDEERLFVQKRFALSSGFGEVVGVGVTLPPDTVPDSAWVEASGRRKGSPLLTFVGRVEKAKGCDELADYFLCYIRERQREDLQLLFLGHRSLPLPPHPQLLTPGRVSEQYKWSALRDSTIVLAPSPHESLCLAALEGSLAGKPLLVNGRCRVLVGHCLRSNGGLWYSNYEEFQACLDLLLADPALQEKLGAQGREYVLATHRWDKVLDRYSQVLDSIART